MKVLVVQNGARHHYAVPAVLASAGMLAGLYTDACGNVGLGRWLSRARQWPVFGRRLQRLHQRQVPDNVLPATRAFAAASAADHLLRRCLGRPLDPHLAERRMLANGFRDAEIVYSSLGWGRAFLVAARRAGLKIVTEFYVRPSLWRVYQEEYLAYPEWEASQPFAGHVSAVGSDRDPCTVSDFVIVPHEGVADDVAAVHHFPRQNIHVVPYAADPSFFELQNQPIPGRILFAGSCCLGKGIHYLAMAAAELARRGREYEFRVAGNVTDLVRSQPVCRHLKFLGRVARLDMVREYAQADIFVLPSLSEGSAGVTYEALAAGVPLVVTKATGSVARDGVEGKIVPERNPAALAAAIEQVVEDRALRARLAQNARARAREFTWEKYGERLVSVLQTMKGK